ncbi:MAG: hypothetical protein Q7S01_02925 [bacterium]|nr:hypothetical protein [bacterium]
MDETNPTDTTASRTTAGSNPAPAAAPSPSAPIDTSAIDRAAATISEQIVSHSRKTPTPPAPPIPPPQPAPAVSPAVPPPPVRSIPVPPIQPIQPVQPPIAEAAPAAIVAPSPSDSEKAAPPAAMEQTPKKPLREDIARIIDKIKLPERMTVKISGEKPKAPAAPPPPPPTPIEEKAPAGPVGNEIPPPAGKEQAASLNASAEKEPESSVFSVHTLKDDLQNVVRDKKMSLVRAVALESEKKKGQEHLTRESINSPHARKILGIVFAITVFLALALVAYFGARGILQQNAGTPQPGAPTALIFTEKTLSFPRGALEGLDLKRTLIIGARNAAQVPLGGIVQIVPTSPAAGADGSAQEQPMNIGEFLGVIGAQASPELIRAFSGNFFLGLHQIVSKLSPVLIIPVNSYERGFAGMLAWEPTMNADLSPIFTTVPAQTIDERGVLVDRQFQDELLNNFDVRVLRDDSGAIQMLYSFPTRTMLIISESPYSFTESLSRLRASRQL